MKTHGAGTAEDRKKPAGGRKKQLNSGLSQYWFFKNRRRTAGLPAIGVE